MNGRQQRGAFALAGLAFLLAGCAQRAPLADYAAISQPEKENKPMEQATPKTPINIPKGKELATLAGGCFWCTEAIFKELKGVERVEPGYAGGQTAHPTYEQVCTGRTGHAESLQILFDPKIISYRDLLHIFFTTHDPTTLNRQGADVGTQYRSAVFYHNEEQKRVAHEVIQELKAKGIWKDPIVTEVTRFSNFYKAEDYHQDYFGRNPNQPYCTVVIAPKVAKFREKYREKLKR